MQDVGGFVLVKEINGCSVTLSFAEMPVEGVMEKIQSVLSYAYGERVQQDLIEITSRK